MCLENGEMNRSTLFTYYLLGRVPGTKEATEGPHEDFGHRYQKSTWKNEN